MKNFIDASLLPDMAFGRDPDIQFAAGYNYAKILDEFSIALAKFRHKRNMNQKEMAELLNISQGMVSQYENATRNISIKTICDHCEKLRLVPQLSFVQADSVGNYDTADNSSIIAQNSDIKYA